MKNEKNITEQVSTVNRILTPPPLPPPQGLSTYIHFYYLFIYLLFQAGLMRGGGG